MELIIAPRNTGEPARDYAYRVLSENIAKLKLYPGCPLNDQEVAVRLGISRTPVREAINQIKNESDIIEIYPQRGMKISLIDTGIINQGRDLRVMLEGITRADRALGELTEALRQLRPELAPDFAKFTRLETFDADMKVFR